MDTRAKIDKILTWYFNNSKGGELNYQGLLNALVDFYNGKEFKEESDAKN